MRPFGYAQAGNAELGAGEDNLTRVTSKPLGNPNPSTPKPLKLAGCLMIVVA
jgi:hypothetical protein